MTDFSTNRSVSLIGLVGFAIGTWSAAIWYGTHSSVGFMVWGLVATGFSLHLLSHLWWVRKNFTLPPFFPTYGATRNLSSSPSG